ncbi:MAG: hypothetical protein K9N57_00205 [Candidatus Marinimicrobia bacterium]|nr:hypothetical protein [Candidatus Neomarinimicrobiota bacterium]
MGHSDSAADSGSLLNSHLSILVNRDGKIITPDGQLDKIMPPSQPAESRISVLDVIHWEDREFFADMLLKLVSQEQDYGTIRKIRLNCSERTIIAGQVYLKAIKHAGTVTSVLVKFSILQQVAPHNLERPVHGKSQRMANEDTSNQQLFDRT